MCLDNHSDCIYAYDPKVSQVKTLVKVKLDNHNLDTMILDFAYSEKDQRIGAVLRNSTLCFWDL